MNKQTSLRMIYDLSNFLLKEKKEYFNPILRKIPEEEMEMFPFIESEQEKNSPFEIDDDKNPQNILYRNITVEMDTHHNNKYTGYFKESTHRGFMDMAISILLKHLLEGFPVTAINVKWNIATLYFKNVEDMINTGDYLFDIGNDRGFIAMDSYRKSAKIVLLFGCHTQHRIGIGANPDGSFDVDAEALFLPENKYRLINSETKKCQMYTKIDTNPWSEFKYDINKFKENVQVKYNKFKYYARRKAIHVKMAIEDAYYFLLDYIL